MCLRDCGQYRWKQPFHWVIKFVAAEKSGHCACESCGNTNKKESFWEFQR